jgi:DNA helicase II / ATP-dependent DNA helicase PcrA
MAVPKRASALKPDPQQKRAIEHLSGPMLVVAGAGTGKTTVLTERIARLIGEGHARADEILALTYTVNAAEEMRRRVQGKLGLSAAQGLQVCTFHHYCYDLLIRAGRGFTVLDDKDLWIFLRRNIRQLQLNYFVRAANVAKFLDDLLDFIRRCHDELVGPEQYANYVSCVARGEIPPPRVSKSKDAGELNAVEALGRCREIALVFATVERMLRERNFGTFGHQILRAYELLNQEAAVLERERAHTRFILVDEFQDANFAQIKVLQKLAGEADRVTHSNIFAVGDPDQGIYRFRGASSDAFDLFQMHFPKCKLVVLNQNRRSTTPILNCAHSIIAQNPGFSFEAESSRYCRIRLFSIRDEGEPNQAPKRAPVEAVMVSGALIEAADAVATLVEQRRRSRCGWKDIAVLYRTHSHRDHIAAELANQGIPFSIEGLDVLDTPQVRDLLACLTAVVSAKDSAALLRVAALPQFSLCPQEFRTAMKNLPRDGKQGLPSVLPEVKGGPELLRTLEQARAETSGKKTHSALLTLIHWFQLPGNPAVQAFLRFTAHWELHNPLTQTGTPGEFLEYLDDFREARGVITLPDGEDENSVKLMSVHSAKGLEFDHVLVLRVVSGSFPSSYREPLIDFPAQLRNSTSASMRDDKSLHGEEERRLFYVAMTRARDTLTLHGTFGRGTKDRTPPGYLRELIKNKEIRPWLKSRTCREYQTDIFAVAEKPEHSRLGEWIALPPGSDLSLTLSASAIDRYQTCPLQFKLEREWRIPAELSAAVQYGASMHRVLLAYYNAVRWQREMSEDELVELFRSDLASEAIADPYQHDLYESQGIAQLKDFLSHPRRAEVLHTEEPFHVKIGTTNLVGRIDRIDRAPDGGVIITDYKTGKPKSQEDADESLQLSLYALAVQEKWGYKAERLIFHNLEGNTAIGTTRSGIQLQQAKLTIAEIASKIAAGQFEANIGFQCNSCAYRLLCPKTEKRIPQLFSITAADRN